ncbi:MAG TPA: sec-independent translocase [Mycobacteriales bacterium]|nr:sec-independent translocase [Mycobacteriales bacterium]
MFDHVGFGEVLVLIVAALFIFGPDRLPRAAAEAGRMLRELRRLTRQATADLRSELGPEIADLDLASLHPRTMVRRALLDDDEPDPAAPAGRELRPGERPPFDPDAT